MGLMKKYFNNTRKPEGKLGEMMVASMNGTSHARLAAWGLEHIGTAPIAAALDVGCGGGANIGRLLCFSDTVCGVDYSDISVQKSKEVNANAVDAGKCRIIKANANRLPFEDEQFDLVTAFETVYFWEDIDRAFSEVNRVLKKGGTFAITNESTGEDKTSRKFAEIIEGMNLYTAPQLKQLMEQAGFQNICVYAHSAHPWICVTGEKG